VVEPAFSYTKRPLSGQSTESQFSGGNRARKLVLQTNVRLRVDAGSFWTATSAVGWGAERIDPALGQRGGKTNLRPFAGFCLVLEVCSNFC